MSMVVARQLVKIEEGMLRLDGAQPVLALTDKADVKITWTNLGLSPGRGVVPGAIFGTYDPATGEFKVISFTYEGVTYVLGTVISDTAPAIDTSKTTTAKFIACVVPAEKLLVDAFAFIFPSLPRTLVATIAGVTYVCGIHLDDFEAIWPAALAARVFENVAYLTPPATITALTVTKLS